MVVPALATDSDAEIAAVETAPNDQSGSSTTQKGEETMQRDQLSLSLVPFYDQSP